MIEIGAPARYTKKLRAKNLRSCATGGLLSASAICALLMLPPVNREPVLVASAVVVFIGGLWMCQRSWRLVQMNQAGIRAETAAAKAVRNSNAYAAAFGAQLSHGDCDIVVVGPQLAAVEVKYGRGKVRLESGKLRDDRKVFGKDPIKQARGQAAALGRLANAFGDPVVCVVGMTNPPFKTGDTVVCSVADLPGVLQALPGRVSRLQAASLTAVLEAGHRA
jgi:hypothetical protein